jgi:hypothetical protein
MATVNAGNLTLADLVKRQDPMGRVASIVELLTQKNSILPDAVFKEGNLQTGERVAARTGLPGVSWRRFNEGISPSKSRVEQWDEACGMLEGLSVVDCELAKLNGNEAAYRQSEDVAFLQSLSNEVETGLFYHSTKTAPEKFNGLSPRFDATASVGGAQIIKHDAAAAGSDQTSIWLVRWGEDSVYGIYPKGSIGGITPHDMGEQLVDDGSGNNKRFRAYVTNWNWKVGLVVRDFRQVVRICNIDTGNGNLVATGSLLLQSMVKAYHQVWNPAGGRLAWYCNRGIGTYLHQQALDSVKNSTLTIERIGGQPITTFLGIPVRETDALLNTEAAVT